MKKSIFATAIFCLSSTLLAEIVPGELLVVLKDTASAAGRMAFMGKFKTSANSIEEHGQVIQLHFAEKKQLAEEYKRLKADSLVEHVQPNYRYRAFQVPNDANFYQQWSLNNAAQTISPAPYPTNNPGTSGMDIGMEEAWDIATDCSSTLVAVVDTGVNYTATELQNNMWDGTNCKTDTGAALGNCTHGYDFVDLDREPMDFEGHGTHVSGTIAAEGNNGSGIAGICWRAKIMAIRALGLDGATTATLAKAINFARINGAKVINMSLGGTSEGYDAVLDQAMTNATNAGIFIVSAAGNESVDVDAETVVPCSLSGAGRICVGAVDQKFNLANFSNYGASKVQISAPGTNILSTIQGVEAVVQQDLFESGWSLASNSWQLQSVGSCFIGAPVLITYPDTFCQERGFTGPISASSSRDFLTLVKNYDFAFVDYRVYLDIDSYGLLTVAQSASSTVNFSDELQIRQQFSDVTGRGDFKASLTGCKGSDHCSLGVKFQSSRSSESWGASLGKLVVKGITITPNQFSIYNGTSMATPHVTGAVALLRSLSPSLTLTDIYNALTTTGTSSASLSGVTSSGRVLNVDQLLRYIPAPTSVSAQQTR